MKIFRKNSSLAFCPIRNNYHLDMFLGSNAYF